MRSLIVFLRETDPPFVYLSDVVCQILVYLLSDSVLSRGSCFGVASFLHAVELSTFFGFLVVASCSPSSAIFSVRVFILVEAAFVLQLD